MHAKKNDRLVKKLRLKNLSTLPPRDVTREHAERRFAELNEELFELQDLMWGAKTHSLLVVLQGRDTAGKDGAVKQVVGCLNPRGVNVVSFGVPTDEERQHDFLWRIHRHTPRHGEVAIFNRSHYEDVLVVRVHGLVPKPVWSARYELINAFEQTLAEHGTIILKFFLHISKDEQRERLLAREEDPAKAWKLNVNDWKERDYWGAYSAAYEAAIDRCSTEHAPWFVIPADKKWFRNLAVAEAICTALRPYQSVWRKKLKKEGEDGRAELERYRQQRRGKGNDSGDRPDAAEEG